MFLFRLLQVKKARIQYPPEMQKTFVKCRKGFLQQKLKGNTYLNAKYGSPKQIPVGVAEMNSDAELQNECHDAECYSGNSDNDWYRNPEFPDYSKFGINKALGTGRASLVPSVTQLVPQ